jgi:hypothetical protein
MADNLRRPPIHLFVKTAKGKWQSALPRQIWWLFGRPVESLVSPGHGKREQPCCQIVVSRVDLYCPRALQVWVWRVSLANIKQGVSTLGGGLDTRTNPTNRLGLYGTCSSDRRTTGELARARSPVLLATTPSRQRTFLEVV